MNAQRYGIPRLTRANTGDPIFHIKEFNSNNRLATWKAYLKTETKEEYVKRTKKNGSD